MNGEPSNETKLY